MGSEAQRERGRVRWSLSRTAPQKERQFMYSSILTREELQRFATKQFDLWLEFGIVQERDRETEIERIITLGALRYDAVN
jgi:hypothetical protein